ncbi:MAG: hypothetical protein HKN90_05900 [Flavobacteriaceae bacterium]|nr:hypothetical protein [Flavobacteriaceae bacterium]
MRKNKGLRMNPTSGYIGSGNKTNFFTNRPKAPFSRMKQIYGEELERFNSTHSSSEANYEKLLIQKKKEIRDKIANEIAYENKKNSLIVAALVILMTMLVIFINYFLPRFL